MSILLTVDWYLSLNSKLSSNRLDIYAMWCQRIPRAVPVLPNGVQLAAFSKKSWDSNLNFDIPLRKTIAKPVHSAGRDWRVGARIPFGNPAQMRAKTCRAFRQISSNFQESFTHFRLAHCWTILLKCLGSHQKQFIVRLPSRYNFQIQVCLLNSSLY